MDMSVEFHCGLQGNFGDPEVMVRAFTYFDYAIRPHTHEFYEMNIILSGSGTHHINQRSVAVKPGHVFVIPPGCIHSYVDTDQLNVAHILIQPMLIRQHEAELSQTGGYNLLMEIEPFLRYSSDQQLFLRLSTQQLLQIQEELLAIDEAAPPHYPASHCFRNHSALRLICLLSHWLELQTEHRTAKIPSDKEQGILLALDYIHKNYAHTVTAEMLCKQAFMSRSTFLRAFRAVCGCTPGQYLHLYRTRRAKELIQTTTLKKTEIAHRCGFYDLSHMERSLTDLSIESRSFTSNK